MVYRYDFNIIRPSSQMMLGAASLGERMRRNRLAEDMAERQQQSAEEKQIADMDQAERDRRRAALGDYYRLIEAVGRVEDPALRSRAYQTGLRHLAEGYGEDAIEGLSPDYDPREAQSAMAALSPYADRLKPGKLQQDIEYLQELVGPLSQEEIKRKGGVLERAPLVDLGGVLSDQPLTPEEAPSFGIAPQDAQKFVKRGGEVRRRDQTVSEQESERMQARRAEGRKAVREVWSDYMSAYEGTPRDPATGELVLKPDDRRRLTGLRDKLVTVVAKNILGTPGAEPSPSLYQRADQIVPDWGVGSEALGFRGAMEALLDPESRASLITGEDSTSKSGVAFDAMSDDDLMSFDVDSLDKTQLKAFIAEAEKRRR